MYNKKAGPKSTLSSGFTPMNFGFRAQRQDGVFVNPFYSDKFPLSQPSFPSPSGVLKFLSDIISSVRTHLDSALDSATPAVEKTFNNEFDKIKEKVKDYLKQISVRKILTRVKLLRRKLEKSNKDFEAKLKSLKYTIYKYLKDEEEKCEKVEKVTVMLNSLTEFKPDISQLVERPRLESEVLKTRSKSMNAKLKERIENIRETIQRAVKEKYRKTRKAAGKCTHISKQMKNSC